MVSGEVICLVKYAECTVVFFYINYILLIYLTDAEENVPVIDQGTPRLPLEQFVTSRGCQGIVLANFKYKMKSK